MIVGQDDAEGGLYDNEEGDDDYGEDTEGADEDWNDGDDCDYGEDAGNPTIEETDMVKTGVFKELASYGDACDITFGQPPLLARSTDALHITLPQRCSLSISWRIRKVIPW
jgi:hypothetical protein